MSEKTTKIVGVIFLLIMLGASVLGIVGQFIWK